MLRGDDKGKNVVNIGEPKKRKSNTNSASANKTNSYVIMTRMGAEGSFYRVRLTTVDSLSDDTLMFAQGLMQMELPHSSINTPRWSEGRIGGIDVALIAWWEKDDG